MTTSATPYDSLSDEDLISLVCKQGNYEAAVYLLCRRHEKTLIHYALDKFGTLDFLDDLTAEMMAHFLGPKGDWAVLGSFQGRSKFVTWYSNVIRNLFERIRTKKIYDDPNRVSIDTPAGEAKLPPTPAPPEADERKIILLEAISRLPDADHRFILIKELEGFSTEEIAQALTHKRTRENRLHRTAGGKLIIPTAGYIRVMRSRDILPQVKELVKQIKKEWYEKK